MTALATEAELVPDSRPYCPYGSARELLRCRAAEVVLSGPAGTGKSRACLEKMHLLAGKYPGMRGLIVRKTRESLTQSALVTFEEHVVEPRHVIRHGASRQMRASYRYPNGSEIVVAGMQASGRDQKQKVFSTEYDAIYVQEAIELTEEEWENLTTRLRNGKMPYQQLFADTNPDSPTHWLNRRCDAGRTKMIACRHEDNPVLFDHERNTWTPAGVDYLAKLDALTGPRKLRLRYGRWVQAEGVVYPEWDMAVHLIDRFPIPKAWRRFIAVDFGYTNPFVAQWWALDGDDRLYRYREIYKTGRLVEDHAARIRELLKEEPEDVWPRTMVCDHDAEGRATLERHLEMMTVPAMKEVREGIQAVATRLRVAGDGKPRIFFMRDSLDERDPMLEERKRPCCTEEEWGSYIWDIRSKRAQGEEPLKENDHGMDTTRYAVRYADHGAGAWTFGGSPLEQSAVYGMPKGLVYEPKHDRDEPVDIMKMRF